MEQQVTYQGSPDGRLHNFLNSAGAMVQAYIADGITAPPVGAQVNAEIETKTSKAGKQYNQVQSINGQRGSFRGGGQPKTGGRPPMSYDPRTFVSNVVGHAIQQGLIKKPEDIAPWAITAYKNIRSLEPAAVRAEVSPATPGTPQPAPVSPAQPTAPDDDIPF